MEILDIHTHHAVPQPEGVVSLCLRKVRIEAGKVSLSAEGVPVVTADMITNPTPDAAVLDIEQKYSVGIHPWDTLEDPGEEEWDALRTLAAEPNVVAVGECGIDLTPKGGPLFRQMQIFKRHVELSEELGKPLVLHDVKAHDIIAGARRDMKPTQPWAIHGFRRKPEVAAMLLRAGCWLSFGAEFNSETLLATPKDRILAETDESPLSIEEVIGRLSAAYGEDLRGTIAENTRRFLGSEK